MSIKSKLITAVTTAGLLASLFGTALLPVARAADDDVDVTSVDLETTDTDVDSTSGGTIYAIAGKTITFTLNAEGDGNDADDNLVDSGVLTVTTVGTTISSIPANARGASALAANAKSATGVYTFSEEDNGDAIAVVMATINVVAPANGASSTLTVSYAGTDAGTEDATVTIIGVAAGTAGVPYANGTNDYTYLQTTCESFDSDGTGGGGAACSDTDYITDGGQIVYELTIRDAYDNPVTSGYFVNASVTGGVGGVEVSDDDGQEFSNVCADDDESSSDKLAIDNNLEICFTSDGTASKPVTLTVSVGSITWTRKIGVIGDVKSMTLTAPAAIASIGNDLTGDDVPEEWADSFVVSGLDAAGNIIGNGGGKAATVQLDGTDSASYNNYESGTMEDGNASYLNDAYFVVTDGNGVPLDFDTDTNDDGVPGYNDGGQYNIGGNGDANDFEDEGAYVSDGVYSYSYAEQGNSAFNVPSGLCEADEAGESRKIHVAGGFLDLVKSNVVTVKCVNNAVKLSGVTPLTNAVAKNGRVTLSFAATDGSGNAVGDGASASITVTPSWEAADAATLYFVGGSASLRITADAPKSCACFLIVERVDNDPATSGNQTWTEKVAVTVTNAADSLTAPSFYKSTAVKARAVVIFPAAAGATIAFTVENARTGVVRTYYRKANAQGKAWYTIAARGTYYVTALYGSESTDTLRLVK